MTVQPCRAAAQGCNLFRLSNDTVLLELLPTSWHGARLVSLGRAPASLSGAATPVRDLLRLYFEFGTW